MRGEIIQSLQTLKNKNSLSDEDKRALELFNHKEIGIPKKTKI